MQLVGKRRLSHKKVSISDSDSEVDFEPVKRSIVWIAFLSRILPPTSWIYEKIFSLFQISKSVKLPLALHRQLQDTFKCNICCCVSYKTTCYLQQVVQGPAKSVLTGGLGETKEG